MCKALWLVLGIKTGDEVKTSLWSAEEELTESQLCWWMDVVPGVGATCGTAESRRKDLRCGRGGPGMPCEAA